MAIRKVTKLDKAKAQIVLDHPFFASILLRHPLQAREDIPTLAVDQRGQIYYNPAFIETLTVPQCVWGLCHEVGHRIGQHAQRKGHREHDKWNYAGDAWINDMLVNAGVGEPIPNTVNMPGSKDKTTEQIYNELPEQEGGEGNSGDQGGSGYMDGDGLGNDILQEGEPLTESERAQLDGQMKVEIAEAAQAARMSGKMSASLQKIVDSILDVKTPWFDILERWMVNMSKSEPSWRRPNRRFIGDGTYLPSMSSEAAMGTIVVQVDISGSVSKREIEYYGGHLSRIIEQCRPEKVHVIYTDTSVQHHSEFGPEDFPVSIEFYSGGGTHMPAGFNWVAEQGIEPACVITLTDGYTEFPKNPNFPAIWCISSDVTAPVEAGETIHFEMER